MKSLVFRHLKTLVLKRAAGVSIDAYGNVDGKRWNAEAQYFLDTVWLPQLNAFELKAVVDDMKSIAQRCIETTVRVECARMHATGEHDMTVPVRHPPDAAKARPHEQVPQQTADRDARHITRGLIIRSEPLERILSGAKTWEMRSAHTKVRGRIGLVQKGSKAVFGVAELVDSRGPLSEAEMLRATHLHGITCERLMRGEASEYRHAWVLQNVRRLPKPTPYQHKGGVIFVTLDEYARAELAPFAGSG